VFSSLLLRGRYSHVLLAILSIFFGAILEAANETVFEQENFSFWVNRSKLMITMHLAAMPIDEVSKI